ncbi:MAG: endolytic transglycosylase MltG [Gammaproteobacteria bacterium]|nr:endolytic transglycosylase MltG [Gammaproteobacteria bacterium]
MRPVNRIARVLSIALLLGAAVAGAGVWQVQRFMAAEVSVPANGIEFEIPHGSAFALVTQKLVDKGVIGNDFWFRLYARWSGEASAVQAGDYLIPSGSTPASILQQFTSGAVRLYSFTIIEGWNHRDLLNALHANEMIAASMSEEDWPGLLADLGASVTHPEGFFLPETYHFPRNTSDRELLRQAYSLMQEVLAEEWDTRDAATAVKSPYEALVLASIVEKETARADERARIAGVFTRRMEKGMRLQTDPTVIYGIGPAFNGNLTRRDLRTDTPYNTYTRNGLPPTPIAMPGRAAINSALNPASGKELFFVATGLGDGSHRFSATKSEHDAAVAEYLKRLRQQRRQGI